MAETAPVFNPDNFTPLDAAPASPVDSNPTFDPNSFKPLNLPNETVLVEETGEVVELPYGSFDQYWKTAKRGYEKGSAETEIGRLGFEQWMGNDTPTIRGEIKRFHKEAGGEIETGNFIDEGVRATAQMVPFMQSVFGKSSPRFLRWVRCGRANGRCGRDFHDRDGTFVPRDKAVQGQQR
mgnify:CR=1 FL=1